MGKGSRVRVPRFAAICVVLAACSSSPTVPVATPTTEATTTTEAAPSPTETTSTPDAVDDLTTAQTLIEAWQDAGLPLGEVRDNTLRQCPPDDPQRYCTALITTDYVSVRVFIDEADAQAWTGPGRETHVIGRVNASFGGDSDFWPFNTEPYIEVMDTTLN